MRALCATGRDQEDGVCESVRNGWHLRVCTPSSPPLHNLRNVALHHSCGLLCVVLIVGENVKPEVLARVLTLMLRHHLKGHA